MAKLSTKDKYTIQGALHDGKTSGEIAKIVGKPEKSVKNYIEGELEGIYDTVTKVTIEKAIAVEKEEDKPTVVIEPPIVPRGQGKRAMSYGEGKRKGVVVMNEGASAVGDEFRKDLKKTRSRTARGALYNTEGEKLE